MLIRMSQYIIYHNPKCSKSREALAFLKGKGVEVRVVEYLKEPLSKEELKSLIAILQGPISALVRTKEDLYQKLKFDIESKELVAKYLEEYPQLMERPIVIKGSLAIIARPTSVLEGFL